jgi:hypothetical protein
MTRHENTLDLLGSAVLVALSVSSNRGPARQPGQEKTN